jgi:hypothetical protein
MRVHVRERDLDLTQSRSSPNRRSARSCPSKTRKKTDNGRLVHWWRPGEETRSAPNPKLLGVDCVFFYRNSPDAIVAPRSGINGSGASDPAHARRGVKRNSDNQTNLTTSRSEMWCGMSTSRCDTLSKAPVEVTHRALAKKPHTARCIAPKQPDGAC